MREMFDVWLQGPGPLVAAGVFVAVWIGCELVKRWNAADERDENRWKLEHELRRRKVEAMEEIARRLDDIASLPHPKHKV